MKLGYDELYPMLRELSIMCRSFIHTESALLKKNGLSQQRVDHMDEHLYSYKIICLSMS